MQKVAISSDSTCGISQARAKELGIFILPLNVIVDQVEFHDGITIDGETLNKRMREGAKIQTSTPTLYEIETFFNKIFEAGYEKIIHFTISSKLSSMFELFTVHCAQFFGDKVTVIDSLGVSTMQESLVLTAKHLIDQDSKIEDIVTVIDQRKADYLIYFVPETLTYLKNGGRISPTVATIGNLIGMKPVLRYVDGAIAKESTTRNYKKTVASLMEYLSTLEYSKDEHQVVIFHFGTSPEWIEIAKKAIDLYLGEFQVVGAPLAINVAAHTGPGTIGFGFVRKPLQ
ncbi:MAG: DegV family protein [Bacilli bacterium]